LKFIGEGSSNGVDTSHFNRENISKEAGLKLRKKIGIESDDFIFIFVGRIVSAKGVNELVSSFDQLSKIYPNVKLLMLGGFERELDPIDLVTEEMIKNHSSIKYVGFQKDVALYFSIADVLVFPSYREGFPNVVMQAASMQLNAIVSDINGCNEIITNGVNGWIVPVRSVDRLKERMEWCVMNPEESKRMGEKSRDNMQDNYERSKLWELIQEEYESLLNNSERNKVVTNEK